MADGRADRTIDDLIDIAIAELEVIRDQAKWRVSELDGARRSGDGGTSDRSDPTHSQTAGRLSASRRLARAKAQIAWVVDQKLPAIVGLLEARNDDPRYDEGPRQSDEDRRDADGQPLGPAELEGGLSAYRGDRRAPKSRPDLQEALDAQARRNARGQGWGRG